MELPVFNYLFSPKDREMLGRIEQKLDIVLTRTQLLTDSVPGIGTAIDTAKLALAGLTKAQTAEVMDGLSQLGAFVITMDTATSIKLKDLQDALNAANDALGETDTKVTKIGVDTQTSLNKIAELIAAGGSSAELQAALDTAQAVVAKVTGINAKLQTIDDEVEDPSTGGGTGDGGGPV